MRSLPFLIGALAVAAVAVTAAPALAAEQGPYPVWWSPSLELESLDKIDQRLARKINPDGEGFRIEVGLGKTRRTALASSCADIRALERQGQGAIASRDVHLRFTISEYCVPIETLKRARPAERSYVRDFVLNAEALDYLPAMVSLSPSCDGMCRLYVANERRISLNEFGSGGYDVNEKSDYAFEIETDYDISQVEILARADFNFDGIEDLLVYVFAKAKEARWGARELFVMTREAPDAVLRVMHAETHICDPEEYEPCDARYDEPPVLR